MKSVKCKYCEHENNDFITLNKTTDYSLLEMSLNRQGMLRVRSIDKQGRISSMEIINIDYCPICGRKLKNI